MTLWLYISVLLSLVMSGEFEWVEITQTTKQPSLGSPESKLNTKFQNQVSKDLAKYYDSDFTTPSEEWLKYQRERFDQSNTNKLIVSVGGNLKHSTQILVPAKVQVIHTKTKLNVRSPASEAEVELVVTPKVETTSRKHTGNDDILAETNYEEDNDDSSLQLPSMQGFLKFLKSMQVSWLKKSALSIEKKIEMLMHLRDNLLKVIEQQFTSLWQPVERKRHKRGILDESTLNFPPEAAIMSINFLTFAVFLIKLVLQVVNIVKSKHYNFAGFNITADVRKTNVS